MTIGDCMFLSTVLFDGLSKILLKWEKVVFFFPYPRTFQIFCKFGHEIFVSFFGCVYGTAICK